MSVLLKISFLIALLHSGLYAVGKPVARALPIEQNQLGATDGQELRQVITPIKIACRQKNNLLEYLKTAAQGAVCVAATVYLGKEIANYTATPPPPPWHRHFLGAATTKLVHSLKIFGAMHGLHGMYRHPYAGGAAILLSLLA